MMSFASFRRVVVSLGVALTLPSMVTAQPTFEDTFNGASLSASWQRWDGYAAFHPHVGDFPNYAQFGMTGTQLSISFPAGANHNMWDVQHAEVVRPFLGTGTYEIKVDSAFTGAQQFGLIFEGAEHGTFLIFMLYSYINDQAKGYVERFSHVDGVQYKTNVRRYRHRSLHSCAGSLLLARHGRGSPTTAASRMAVRLVSERLELDATGFGRT